MPDNTNDLKALIASIIRASWMSEAQLTTFNEAQMQWQKYAEAQSKFIAAEYVGGSMYSEIYSQILNELTYNRIIDLKNFLDDKNNRYA